MGLVLHSQWQVLGGRERRHQDCQCLGFGSVIRNDFELEIEHEQLELELEHEPEHIVPELKLELEVQITENGPESVAPLVFEAVTEKEDGVVGSADPNHQKEMEHQYSSWDCFGYCCMLSL